jgi:formate-dependent nitrite reductase cytochrome c552 subunit
LQLLQRVTTQVAVNVVEEKKVNPKRRSREVAKEMAIRGISTKAQQVLKLEFENLKRERKETSKAVREEEKEQKRLLARQKAKERHRGRA